MFLKISKSSVYGLGHHFLQVHIQGNCLYLCVKYNNNIRVTDGGAKGGGGVGFHLRSALCTHVMYEGHGRYILA